MLVDPVNYVDPAGKMSSRPFQEIPRYGNWCGKNWCGGQEPSKNNGEMGDNPPIDDLDQACKTHDECYGGDKSKSSCDKEFVKELDNVSDGSFQKRVIKKGAQIYFGR